MNRHFWGARDATNVNHCVRRARPRAMRRAMRSLVATRVTTEQSRVRKAHDTRDADFRQDPYVFDAMRCDDRVRVARGAWMMTMMMMKALGIDRGGFVSRGCARGASATRVRARD